MKRSVGVFCVGLCVMVGVLALSSGAVWASAAACSKMIKAKEYLKAASCYEQAAQQVDQDPAQKSFAVLLKERYFRYSALAFQRAAEATQKAEKAYYLERSVEQLGITIRERYCRAARRCRQNQLLADKLKAQIRYGTLVISSKDPKASITVKGFQYLQVQQKDFTKQVRPGTYTVTVKFPKQAEKQSTVQVGPGEQVLLDVSPVTQKMQVKRLYTSRRVPPLILASYIVGGVLILGGGAMGGYGLFSQTAANAKIGDPNENRTYSDSAYASEIGSARVLTVVGMSAVGLGIAVIVGGAIAQSSLSSRKSPPSNAGAKSPNQGQIREGASWMGRKSLGGVSKSSVLWRSF
ncbi:MAG: hypothetical protein H6728_13785 [Myxococcales bacterium]|nr:hypothetical protein [Myxococcales bacterium]MCB9644141.1 hypothetical protein [Myxococcales bacterium]